MEACNLVVRLADPTDGRATRFRLTQKAKSVRVVRTARVTLETRYI